MTEQTANRDEFLDQGLKKDELQCILEEYKSLRTEAQACMGHRVTLLTSSTATAGVLLGLALNILNSKTTNARYSTEILLLVPLTTCLFGLLTTYHTALIYDMADYLKLLEIRVNKVYPLAMGWYASSNGSQFPKIFWIWHLPMMLITLAPSTVAVLLFFRNRPQEVREQLGLSNIQGRLREQRRRRLSIPSGLDRLGHKLDHIAILRA